VTGAPTAETGGAMMPSSAPGSSPLDGPGMEWVVEAFGCDVRRLADPNALAALVDEMVTALALTPVAPPHWHRFPHPGGVTGLLLLAESHIALHTFPEHASLCLNLFCCRPRTEWNFAAGLARTLGATRVVVRQLARDYSERDAGA
jgi:S-adenosylmethionine decarboxylase